MTLQAQALLKKYGQHAKKSWGQNFLVEERVFSAIVRACGLSPRQSVIEIGAGLGTLTARLAEAAGKVIAIERDRDMVEILRNELGSDARIEIVEANALTFDYVAAAKAQAVPPVVVGNLPYQIASPLLFRLLEARAHLSAIVVMLQREMVDRILAPPGNKTYGALSVMVRVVGEPRLVTRVAAGSFVPPPRVESAVLKIVPFEKGKTRVPIDDFEHFHQLVRASFSQRRKTLRNALSVIAEKRTLQAAFAETKIDPGRRGETLSVEEFAELSNAIGRSDARAA